MIFFHSIYDNILYIFIHDNKPWLTNGVLCISLSLSVLRFYKHTLFVTCFHHNCLCRVDIDRFNLPQWAPTWVDIFAMKKNKKNKKLKSKRQLWVAFIIQNGLESWWSFTKIKSIVPALHHSINFDSDKNWQCKLYKKYL